MAWDNITSSRDLILLPAHVMLFFFIFSYVFSTGAAICEVGKLNDDNSVSIIEGLITFNLTDRIVHLNYTANATVYNVLFSMSPPRIFRFKNVALQFSIFLLQIMLTKMARTMQHKVNYNILKRIIPMRHNHLGIPMK